ncbi:MAG: hypothetical protein GDA56_01540 [Hormoscilla sp. GM7CHS1pb]|nr:hypothetical protein [Hormoscilla sp. GM7CHS1pb]
MSEVGRAQPGLWGGAWERTTQETPRDHLEKRNTPRFYGCAPVRDMAGATLRTDRPKFKLD